MKKQFRTWLLAAAIAVSWAATPDAARGFDWPTSNDEPVVTQHQITLNGKVLRYTARAGFISLRDEFNKTHGRIFYVYYKLDSPEGKSVRPLTFAWNGGPGSSASLIQLAALGPFRVKDRDEYSAAPPPYQLAENESTWLDTTDLVFVDPVGTGYSYATEPEFGKEFWSRKGDVDSIAEFIRLFLSHYDYGHRTPLFLVGESYGTLRAAGVAAELTDKKFNVAGVVLISSVLELGRQRSDQQYILLVPAYTVAGFVHKKLSSDLQSNLRAAMQKSEEWAVSQYSVALLKGNRLTQAEREHIAQDLARFTGLSEQFVMKHDLRVGMEEFAGQLLKDEKQVLGHYDVRAVASNATSEGEYDPTLDPSLNTHGTGEVIVPYLREQLKFQSDAFYAGPFGGRWPSPTQHRGDWMSVRWDWSEATAVDGRAALARAMRENQAMRVLVICGLYDLSTPCFGSEYDLDHLDVDSETRARAELVQYEGGHMAYLDAANRKRLKQDFVSLTKRTLSAPGPQAAQ